MRKAPRKSPSRKRPIAAEDLYRLRIPTSVAISPDESRVAYTVERMDKDDLKYYSNLFVGDLRSGAQRQYTFGKTADGSPLWSPAGDRIAFISTRDKKTGIYLIGAAGGAERKVIDLDGALDSLQWAPDGRHLVFALRWNDSHFIEKEEDKKKPPVFRHITRLYYRLDGSGFVPKDRFQVYTLDVESAALRRVTGGRRDNTQPAVSPDGRWIAYISNRRPDPDVDMLYDDLFVIPFGGGREHRLPTPAGPKAAPSFSPDSRLIAYIGHDNPRDAWGVTNHHIWTVGRTGSPKAVDLMPAFDRMALDMTISDLAEGHGVAVPRWSPDSRRIFFIGSDTGRTSVYFVPARGGQPTRVFDGKCHVKALSLAAPARTAAIIYSDLATAGEIVTFPAVHGGEKRAVTRTALNPFLVSEVVLGKTKDLMFRSFDGTAVQGWIVYPPAFRPNRKYPSILEIHGGPRMQYGYTFFHEMQWLAAQGYVVFYTNPRGGQGRGQTWADAISGGWGGLDYQDCMAAADFLAAQPFIDPKRMGVTGGSYGGYMTNWIIGHTDRFKAAVTQRSVVNFMSMYGASDIGWSLERELDGTPWNNSGNYEKCSPITYFTNVRTPVLILHNEQDLRCGIEQAEQMFTMLKRLRRTVEMVRFPEEPHGLSRHGRPDRRIARLTWIARWFDRYLK
ncbi:MAG TPA: S9 family peptidase [candidate division Zixibacteria bacterium]|nr:S9 family peptidase [candidate division Zixibacteria bacterium]MDD4918108.1 S9 family peptidase [candidate division Zixibacteria bacterium]HOD67107.1 S9 family peptidase [candidate division Zixibacteria bacterium]HPM37374.1 S9 family peptidase [candidate division Zixibacteria bacterium]HQL24315.1 S9 family peptidase [candidate division Zixibacteria bacterium]